VIDMAEDECSICGKPLVKIRYVPSALDGIKACPKCNSCDIGFLIPKSLGSCVVDCLCDACGHVWSVRVVLPKNFFGKNFGKK
jgi:hypothetical protein